MKIQNKIENLDWYDFKNDIAAKKHKVDIKMDNNRIQIRNSNIRGLILIYHGWLYSCLIGALVAYS